MNSIPEPLLRFIDSCIPTFQAAEVLLLVAAEPRRMWRVEDVVAQLRPAAITGAAVEEYLALFKHRGILDEQEGSFYYAPSSREIEDSVIALADTYNHKPVTLIRVIYSLADRNIQSFADAFKRRKGSR